MNVFEQIDKELSKKEPKELYAIYFVIVLGIGFLFYQYVYPMANEMYTKAADKNQQLVKSIKSKKMEIMNTQTKLARGSQEIKKLKRNIVILNNRADELKKEVQKLSFVIFDSKEWANLLKDSVLNAIKEGMNVNLVSSEVENVKGYLKCFVNEKNDKDTELTLSKLGGKEEENLKSILNSYIVCRNEKNNFHFINKKLTFTLIIKSKYKNLLSYIYSYENRRELFRIESLTIDKTGNYIVKISLYGYEK